MDKMSNDSMLKEMPIMADIANTAVFLASPMAGKYLGNHRCDSWDNRCPEL